MTIKEYAEKLELLEGKAGIEGWGGEFRESMFEEMLRYLQLPHRHVSVGLLMAHLISFAQAEDGDGE